MVKHPPYRTSVRDSKPDSTMLYGLIENYSHRIDHLSRLRNLQDETGGFNAFIPLKFKHYNNKFSHIEEAPVNAFGNCFQRSAFAIDIVQECACSVEIFSCHRPAANVCR